MNIDVVCGEGRYFAIDIDECNALESSLPLGSSQQDELNATWEFTGIPSLKTHAVSKSSKVKGA